MDNQEQLNLVRNFWDTYTNLVEVPVWYCNGCSAWFLEEAEHFHEGFIESINRCPSCKELQMVGLQQNGGVWS
jgi:rubrerythrin